MLISRSNTVRIQIVKCQGQEILTNERNIEIAVRSHVVSAIGAANLCKKTYRSRAALE